MNEKLLEVKDLTIAFYTDVGIIRAVNDVSFDVSRRTTVGLVGESGCGKSVTARALLNIVQPPGRIDGGQVLFHDQTEREPVDLLSMKPKGVQIRSIRGNEIAMIFQDPMTCLSPVHTVGNQIAESIKIHESSVTAAEAKERAIGLLAEVGIPNPAVYLDSYSFELSGGMRQRALMAVALAAEPDLLIADEPTTAIDVTIQAKFLDLIKKLQQDRHMSILFITHDLGIIAEVSKIVIVMYLGRVVEMGNVEDIYDHPYHPYTQLLFRSIPRDDIPSKSPLAQIKGSVPDPFSRPSGCPFGDRCPRFMVGRCDRSVPPLYDVAQDHQARCFLYE